MAKGHPTRIALQITVLSALALWPLLVPAQSLDVTQREPKAIRDRCANLAEQRDAGTLPLRREAIAAPSGPGAMVAGQLRPRVRTRKPVEVGFDPTAHTGRIVLKLADDEGFRVDAAGGLTAEKPERATSVTSVVTQALGQAEVKRVFTRPELHLAFDRFCGERWTGEEMPDLTQFLLLAPREAKTAAQMETLVRELNAMAFVEIAYFEGLSAPPLPPRPDARSKTEPLEWRQGYLNAAPQGIDAYYAWSLPGGKGQYAKIIDVEFSWDFAHEDSPNPFVVIGAFDPAPINSNHGTAVLGILGARQNGLGIIGIASDSAIGVAASYVQNATIATAIDLASATLLAGDVILVERQVAGPPGLQPGPNCPQVQLDTITGLPLVPAEYDLTVYGAIKTATANRRIVVEAAGNSGVGLTDPLFLGVLDPTSAAFSDSGAILVGGRDHLTQMPKCESNYGARVDASAWGSAITTAAGLSELIENLPADAPNRYTGIFAGTSGAAAIVAGTTVLIQSIQTGRREPVLSPVAIRTLFRTMGTPQGLDVRLVGKMPDLRQIEQWMIADTDRDGVTNGVELARGRSPSANEAALVGAILPVLED